MKKIFYVLWGVAFVLGSIGVAQRLMYGHEPAAYGNRVVWGLWVAMYIYFIGLSAGAFLLSSLVYVFKIKMFEKVGKLALITALVTLLCALLSIWLDLGHMWRAYEVITRPNLPHSMMAWMIWLYSAYFLLLILETLLAFKIESGKYTGEILKSYQKRLKVYATIGIPLAIAFHGGVGALFGVVASNPMWHSALTPIFFLVGAVASGSALFTMIFAFFWENKTSEYYQNMLRVLAKIVLVAVLFDLLLEWAELSIALWMGTPAHTAGFREMLFGNYWFVFWIFHLLLGVIVPVWILAVKKDPIKIGIAAFLVVFTFIGVRLNIVIPGLVAEKVHGQAQAYIHPRLAYSYFPSMMEWLVGIFIIAFGIGLFYLANRYFKLTEENKSIKA
ncbi:MAG: polysulfide reductase NrfD [Lutibacter sp.]|nr:polysulfide reductase NrfD [Lutibacter sp.]